MKNGLKNWTKREYIKNKDIKITKDDILRISLCTKEAPPKIVLANLNKLKEYSNRLEEVDVKRFIEFLEKKYKNEK